ncbi:MAG: hypothetical protein AAF074_08150 [Pseudomonadota bacterium]
MSRAPEPDKPAPDMPAIERTPGRRFVRRLELSVRIWMWLIGIAVLVTLLGIVPSLVGIVALMGPVWVPIALLIFWGRMLDETMHLRSDMEDGPR